MRLALDNHYSPVIAKRLRDAGHDAVAAIERRWEALDDEILLSSCADEGRTLLTNDVADFVAVSRAWAAIGRSHAGLIFTADASMPRGRSAIGRYVGALDALMGANPGDEAFRDRIEWLSG